MSRRRDLFLPCDATQSAVMPQCAVCCLSVSLYVRLWLQVCFFTVWNTSKIILWLMA